MISEREAVLGDTASAPPPIPTTERTCGLPGASSVMVAKASAGPTAVGEKLISKEHVARGGIGVPMQGSEPTIEKEETSGRQGNDRDVERRVACVDEG